MLRGAPPPAAALADALLQLDPARRATARQALDILSAAPPSRRPTARRLECGRHTRDDETTALRGRHRLESDEGMHSPAATAVLLPPSKRRRPE